MKNFINFTLTLILSLTAILNLAIASSPDFTHCTWNSWFEYPNKSHFSSGEDVYVRVKAQKYQDIMFMELYCNNQYIRKESSSPYEWCQNGGSGDSYLRNLSPGNYKLKVKIKDKCGYTNYISRDIVVSGSGGGGNQPTTCHFGNPLMDLHWLKTLKQQYPNRKINEYTKNGKTYFQIYQCGITHYGIYWYDCQGNMICDHLNTQQPCGTVSGAHFKKCWYDPCGGGGNHNTCVWHSEIEHYLGALVSGNVYVKVTPQKYQDIAYIDLYVDNQYVRRESQYPYEWNKPGTSGDQKLKGLIPGNHSLKAKIKDKCGQEHIITKHIYVPISL